jgi:hypothetical protein
MNATLNNGVVDELASGSRARDGAVSKAKRLRHTPGGVRLGKDASRESQRKAAAILEVLAGVRTPTQAAEVLGISLMRYFQLEAQAMQALVKSCEPKARGPGRNPDRELAVLRKEKQKIERELARQQTLARIAQRTIGLAPPPAPTRPSPGKKKRRRPVVRALAAARYLQQQEAAESIPAPEIQEPKE